MKDGINIITTTKSRFYLKNRKYHRENGPAISYSDGHTEYWLNGVIHREDGPAVIYKDGSQRWVQNGDLHRIDGPACIYNDGQEQWFRCGIYHREDGPAKIILSETGYWLQEYWLNGTHYPNIKNDVLWRIEVHRWKRNQIKNNKGKK